MLKSTTLIGLEGGGDWGARSAREHVLRAALGLLHPPCELIEPIGAMNVKPSEDVWIRPQLSARGIAKLASGGKT